jgi:hypothetical protein
VIAGISGGDDGESEEFSCVVESTKYTTPLDGKVEEL